MTDAEIDIIVAEVKAELCFTIPPRINTADKWCDTVDKSAIAIKKILQKRNKEDV